MAKTLVIYYSRKGQNYVNGAVRELKKGNTEIVAEFIADEVGADLFEIETVKEYSADYMTCTEEAQEELRAGARPQLKKMLDSVAEYDNIVVAGPCWWGTYPCAVFTQLEHLDFTGKKVFPVNPINYVRSLNFLDRTLESPPKHPHMSRRTLMSPQE